MTTRKRKKLQRVKKSQSGTAAVLDALLDEPLSFASALRAIRDCDELTQADVANRIGITRAHICDIEKGRKLVGPDRAARFAQALGYSPEQFVRLALQDQLNAAGLKMRVDVEAA